MLSQDAQPDPRNSNQPDPARERLDPDQNQFNPALSKLRQEGLSELQELLKLQDTKEYAKLNWRGSFGEYLDLVKQNPDVARNAFQRVYDMIISYGTTEYTDVTNQKVTHYKFFDDPLNNGKDAVFGLDKQLEELVHFFKAAAEGLGTEKRMLLLHGPVGSAKSTIARLVKQGLEAYSKTDDGLMYTFGFVMDKSKPEEVTWSPMQEEPLNLVPKEMRKSYERRLNSVVDGDYAIKIENSLCPATRFMFKELREKYDGDLEKVFDHVVVKRLVLSEEDRIGIGTFQPKDEKNQDSTELTGDVNYRKLAQYGTDSDPRAFNFDGEFNVGNRGVVEFIEVLKLDVAFLYDLLCATQEHKIKPKKFPQTDIDEVIIGHTNEPEFRRLQNNEFMEALRDRTVKVDVPYCTKLSEEIKIYEKSFNPNTTSKHVAPHTLEMAAMWAVLTRLEEPKHASLTALQKLKLYDGKSLPGFTAENVHELRSQVVREGLDGISPRYIQDKISNCLVRYDTTGINPFMVLKEIEAGLAHHSLIKDENQRGRYKELLAMVKSEYEDIVKNEVQQAIAADESGLARLCGNYIDNVKAYTQREKVKNRYTGEREAPDEKLMRSIEEKIDIPESRKDDFRREIMNYIGALAIDGRKFDYTTNERLRKALELKLFEDQKDTIKLTSLVASVVDKATQEKIDVVKSRMIQRYGYNEESATDVLHFVASIFARGNPKK